MLSHPSLGENYAVGTLSMEGSIGWPAWQLQVNCRHVSMVATGRSKAGQSGSCRYIVGLPTWHMQVIIVLNPLFKRLRLNKRKSVNMPESKYCVLLKYCVFSLKCYFSEHD